MIITKEWLIEHFNNNENRRTLEDRLPSGSIDKDLIEFGEIELDLIGLEANKFIERLIEIEELEWANWLITQVLSKKNCVAYALYATKQAFPIWEKYLPHDNRPKKAIDAVWKWLNGENPIATLVESVAESADTAAYTVRPADDSNAADVEVADACAATAFADSRTAYAALAEIIYDTDTPAYMTLKYAYGTDIAYFAVTMAVNAINNNETYIEILSYGLLIYELTLMDVDFQLCSLHIHK